HHYPALAPDEYAEVPANTSILGAAKFSGKTRHGWSIGILESVTAEEKATIDREGVRRQEVVEPLTNFFVGRLQKDIRQGNTIIGGIFTAVNRRLDGTGLEDLLHRSAYAGGMDFQHFWKDRNYVFTARGVFSRVQGSSAAIAATQTAFEHLFQRPDAPHLRVDSTRTHLQGHAGTLKLAKFGGGHWRFETGLTWRSPELELNDAGFLLSTDEINQFTWVGYRIWEPFGIFRNFNLNLNQWNRWNFDGRHLYQAFNVNANTLFKNYWMTGAGLTIETLDISQNALRGGPALRRPPGWAVWAFVNSPQRRKVQFFGNGFMARAFGGEVKVENLSPGVRIQITDPLDLVLRPSFFRARRQGDQYVTQTDFQGTPRYIVGAVEQKTLQFVIRLNYAITPDLSLQYYGQPFISRATYEGFGFVQAPDARSFTERFHRFSPAQITLQGDTFEVDENEDKTVDYTFAKPDFNFVQFRSNLVLRWEYLPGSELFLVWSQSSTPDAFDDLERGLLSSLSDNLFGTKAHNIFLLKTTYRFLK
ncbi:MAG: hydrolase, partial [Bacteroidetes bacterium]